MFWIESHSEGTLNQKYFLGYFLLAGYLAGFHFLKYQYLACYCYWISAQNPWTECSETRHNVSLQKGQLYLKIADSAKKIKMILAAFLKEKNNILSSIWQVPHHRRKYNSRKRSSISDYCTYNGNQVKVITYILLHRKITIFIWCFPGIITNDVWKLKFWTIFKIWTLFTVISPIT